MLAKNLVYLSIGLLMLCGTQPPAAATFIEEEQFGGRHTISVAWGDFDRDGDEDLAVGNFGGANQLFINDGLGGFTEAPLGTEARATFAVAWADCDNDGDLDLAVGNGSLQPNKLFVNQGDGSFVEELQFGQGRTTSVAWADYDLDGDLDLAVGAGILGAVEQNYLYINNGDGTFLAQAQFGEEGTGSIAWGDYDADGDPDLAVGNGCFGREAPNALYINNGDGSFTTQLDFGALDTACIQWGDADGDGDLDLAVGNWNAAQSYLFVNNADGTFTGLDRFGLDDTNTLAWGDADSDGDLDVATGNGDFQGAGQNRLYLNDGSGSFTEIDEFGEGSTDGVAWADSDDDGDLDLAAGNEHSPDQNYLYVNQGAQPAVLTVRLEGCYHSHGAGFSNRDGIGAKLFVYAAGHLGEPAHLLGFREIASQGGFSCQNAMAAHFGLPGQTQIDLRVIWPGSAGTHLVQDLTGIAIPQALLVIEAQASGVEQEERSQLPDLRFRVIPHPAVGEVGIFLEAAGRRPHAIDIYDLQGTHVRTLALSGPDAGGRLHSVWDGHDAAGRRMPAGLYCARLEGAAWEEEAGRVLLLR